MTQTLSNADAALKSFYLPGIRSQLNDDIPLLQHVEKNTTDIEGRYAVLSLNLKRNAGVGARPDGGTLPTAGQQGYGEERVPLKYLQARGAITGPTIRGSKSDKGSFARLLKYEMQRIRTDLRRDVNRQLWGTTDGKIATCTVASNTVTIGLATATTTVQMRQFEVGMLVDIGTVASPTGSTSANAIVSVDIANKTITLTSAATTATTDFVFRSGNVGANVSYELTGMQSIVDSTGALFNLNPATAGQAAWASTEQGSVGAISENVIASNVHAVQIASGEWVDMGICSDGVHRAFANLLTALKRFPGTRDLKGGYKGLDFAAGGPTIPIVWDRDCPGSSLFLVNTKHLTEYQGNDWEWMDMDGSSLNRVANQDAYEFTLVKDMELATDQRNAHAKLTGITEAS